MKGIDKIWMYLYLLAVALTGCDDENETMSLPESPTTVTIMGYEDSFIETRASNVINRDGLGKRYGDIYIRQRKDATGTTEDSFVEVVAWGKYQVPEGQYGVLEHVADIANSKKLEWEDSKQRYVFQALNVPKNILYEDQPSNVKIDMKGAGNGNIEESRASGKVTFAGGIEALKGGLEYFVGAGVGPWQLLDNGEGIVVTLRRQVAKVQFSSISRLLQDGSKDYSITKCTIIFPNQPQEASFNFDEFHKEYDDMNSIPNSRIGDFATLHPTTEPNKTGVEFEWLKNLDNVLIEGRPISNDFENDTNIVRSVYLMPFKYWETDHKYEEQAGFFIVKLPGNGSEEERVYTGNLLGSNSSNSHYLRAGHYADVSLTLTDGTEAGGTGSMIIKWNKEEKEEVPHHPVPGIYKAEEAKLLLEALQKNDTSAIPKNCYKQEMIDGKTVNVIRLFTNIDWSQITEELHIPDSFVLVCQGYKIQLGKEGKITGEITEELHVITSVT